MCGVIAYWWHTKSRRAKNKSSLINVLECNECHEFKVLISFWTRPSNNLGFCAAWVNYLLVVRGCYH